MTLAWVQGAASGRRETQGSQGTVPLVKRAAIESRGRWNRYEIHSHALAYKFLVSFEAACTRQQQWHLLLPFRGFVWVSLS